MLRPTMEKLGLTVPEAAAPSWLGPSIYQAIGEGRSRIRKYGARTIITRDDLASFLKNLPMKPKGPRGICSSVRMGHPTLTQSFFVLFDLLAFSGRRPRADASPRRVANHVTLAPAVSSWLWESEPMPMIATRILRV